jgi:hypothetical protein
LEAGNEMEGFLALAAWHCGHRIRHRNRCPGFESRTGYKVFRENTEGC